MYDNFCGCLMATVTIKGGGNSFDAEVVGLDNLIIDVLTKLGIGKNASSPNDTSSQDPVLKAMSAAGDKTRELSKVISFISNDFKEFNPQIVALTAAFTLANISVDFVTGAFNSLFSVSGNMVGQFIQGKKALGDYATALANGTKGIPILGTFTELIAEGVTQLDSLNSVILELTNSGASFNGSMSFMIESAASAGLSVGDFAKIVKDNADKFSTFGSVMSGVNTFTNVARITMSRYSDVLADAGISLAEYNTELPKVLNLFAVSAKNHGASDEELAESAKELTLNFNAMSKISGKTREQQIADLEKQVNDAAFQQFMLKQSKNVGEKYVETLNTVNTTMGESYGELYKLSVLGIPPLNKELQVLLATTPNLSKSFQEMTAINQAGLAGAARNAAMNPIVAETVETMINSGKGFETAIKAASAGMGGSVADIAKAQQYLLEHSKEFIDADGKFNQQRFLLNLEQAQKLNSITNNLSKFSTLMSELQKYFVERVIGPLMDKIGPAIDSIINAFGDSNQQDIIKTAINNIASMIVEFGDWVSSNTETIKEYIVNIIKIVVDVVTFIVELVSFIVNHWEFVKLTLEAFAVSMILIFGLLTVVISALLVELFSLDLGFGALAASLYALITPILPLVVVFGLLVGAIVTAFNLIPDFLKSASPSKVLTPSATQAFNVPAIEPPINTQNSSSSPSVAPQTPSDDHAPRQTELLSTISSQMRQLIDNTSTIGKYTRETATNTA